MERNEEIKNSKELEFAVFCIENIAEKLGIDAERVYTALTKKEQYPEQLYYSGVRNSAYPKQGLYCK